MVQATQTETFRCLAYLSAAARCGRRLSASAPLPVSISVYSAATFSGPARPSLPQTYILDRSRQRFGLILPTVGYDLFGIPLKPVIVQDVAIGSRIVITAHPKTDEIPFFW